jgi:hypothetical protein
MPLWLEMQVLLMLTYAAGLGLGWIAARLAGGRREPEPLKQGVDHA